MANVHSAIKQIRKDARKRARNQGVLSELKTLWRRFSTLPPTETNQANPLAQELISKWDRAAGRGVVPKGRANRKKSRIAHHLNRFKAAK